MLFFFTVMGILDVNDTNKLKESCFPKEPNLITLQLRGGCYGNYENIDFKMMFSVKIVAGIGFFFLFRF